VRIHGKGIRTYFDLESANQEEAAAKARDNYLSLVAKGWASPLAELAPPGMPPMGMKDGESDRRRMFSRS